MPRRPDWEQRLHALVEKTFARPHSYGEWDCMLLSAATIKALTGKDPGKGHRGKYSDPLSAARYLKSLGFDSFEAMIDSYLPEVTIGFAQRGDLALCAVDDGQPPRPGLVIGDHALVIGTDGANDGMFRVPRKDWVKAWAVGRE